MPDYRFKLRTKPLPLVQRAVDMSRGVDDSVNSWKTDLQVKHLDPYLNATGISAIQALDPAEAGCSTDAEVLAGVDFTKTGFVPATHALGGVDAEVAKANFKIYLHHSLGDAYIVQV